MLVIPLLYKEMILEEATFETFGYHPSELKWHSNKPLLATCDGCYKIRTTSKDAYRKLCRSCAHRRENISDKTRKMMSDSRKGDRNPNFGKNSKVKIVCPVCGTEKEVWPSNIKDGYGIYCSISCGLRAHVGKKSHHYKGGKGESQRRHSAKRRQLGHTPLNSYFEGCEGHHITHNFIIYIPTALHRIARHNLNTGQGMDAINTLALDFLVNGF